MQYRRSIVRPTLTVVLLGTLLMTHPVQDVAEATTSDTVRANDAQLGLELFKQVAKPTENVAFSPFSINTALGMTLAGAKGDTAEAMGKALHVDPSDPRTQENLAGVVASINEEGKRGELKLTAANALFSQEGEEFVPEYLRLVTSKYGAEVRALDFLKKAEASRKEINAWVEVKTAEKIKNLLAAGTITPATSLVLVNAVYFKGTWLRPFQATSTSPAPFHLLDGKTVDVPTMHQTENHAIGEFDGTQVLRLPYKGGRQSMIIVLPRQGQDLSKFEAEMTHEKVSRWVTGLTNQRVRVSLPKFKTTSNLQLKEPLKKLGMGVAFSGSADFTGIRPSGGIYLSEVVHQAFVEVNEEGTEAAAATAVIAVRSMAFAKPPVEFRADHPFLFLIRDDQTGSWLFLGRVANPMS